MAAEKIDNLDLAQEHLVNEFLDEKLKEHPLPWSIEHDWSVEIHDAKGGTVTKCMYREDGQKAAEAIIELAQVRAEFNAHIATEIDSVLSG